MAFWIADNTQINSQIISDLIKDHQVYHDLALASYNNYIGTDLPIQSRTFTDPTKVNSRISNDFRGEIVDQITGFMYGKPVNYMCADTTSDKDKKYFQKFIKGNNMDDVDLETGKYTAVCGSGSRLLYINPEGEERVMYVPSWETIFVYNRDLTEVELAIRYYLMTEMVSGVATYITKVEVYDKTTVNYYTNYGGAYVPDISIAGGPTKKHGFDLIPLIEFPNNNQKQSDFYKCDTYIDAYDRLVSDCQNEIEEFRLAYLLMMGIDCTDEELLKMKQTGCIRISSGENVDIKYLVKEINDVFVENHKKTLLDNIYRFSKSVDISNENFTGSGASGETRKWLMVNLELKAAIKEMKFRKATMDMFKCLATVWAKKDIVIDPLGITIQVDRLYPAELLTEADIQGKLKGVVSNRTRLSLASFVRDVDAEIKALEDEEPEPAPEPDPEI